MDRDKKNVDLTGWVARQQPSRHRLEGRYVRVEKLAPEHADGLYRASCPEDAKERFRWLSEEAPPDREAFERWLVPAMASRDPLFYAVIDRETGEVGGRQAFMRIDAQNGVIEIGSIYWGPDIARSRKATEAFYLFARHAFEDLAYRRLEWKCNDRNAGSKRAALRFGFRYEGLFRQHMIVKDQNRDTAWFAMLDHEWPRIRDAFDAWLAPQNFDKNARQRNGLGTFLGDFLRMRDSERQA